jgi:CRISPR-associated protein Csm1
VQVFLQGKLLGIEPFVEDASGGLDALAGRCLYTSLLSEAIPRALLDSLNLSRQLLGASGGGQFLAMLTSENLPQAHEFLTGVTRRLAETSRGRLRLAWSATENLGDWSDVRKRLRDQMVRWRGCNALDSEGLFDPFLPAGRDRDDTAFAGLFRALPASLSLAWDEAAPLMLSPGGESLPLACHAAPDEQMEGPAMAEDLAARASGRKTWGILRGDVDQFALRLRRAQSVEEHLQCSVFFRQFLAGELHVLCSQGEFWQRATILYTGGDDFAVAGSWDALIPLAREMERLFKQSVEEFLKDFPGPEGKSLSMGIALAEPATAAPAAVFSEAGRQLEIAKAAGKDTISVLGRTLDWKQLSDAAELKSTMMRLVEEFGCSPLYLGELAGFYRETDRVLPARTPRGRVDRQARPWRFHRRLNRMLEGPERHRDYQKARASLMSEFVARNQAQLKLRPSGRVALEWARLAVES